MIESTARMGEAFMSKKIFRLLLFIALLTAFSNFLFAQPPRNQTTKVRPVSIPISIFSKGELKGKRSGEFLEAGDLTVKEDGDEQTILSIRSMENTNLAVAILIQDDLSSNVNLELNRLADFIRLLPENSRVLVAYLRGGSIQVRQKFTTDLDKAAKSLRIVVGSASAAPSNPYVGVAEALNRFDALPVGRRAILLISDGLDTSRGFDSSTPSQSLDLDQAILKAQRKSVAVYSFYTPATLTENGSSILTLNGQGSLQRLADETGGRAFFQGTGAPVSFVPFFKDFTMSLKRQFLLTYLSTHAEKGYHKIQINSTNPDIKIEYPKGYFFR
ncbi:MAG: VWA domain-containing protein [Pyrinomonadaceae bacterium]